MQSGVTTPHHGGHIAATLHSHHRMEGSGGQDSILLTDTNWGQDIEDLSLNTGWWSSLVQGTKIQLRFIFEDNKMLSTIDFVK